MQIECLTVYVHQQKQYKLLITDKHYDQDEDLFLPNNLSTVFRFTSGHLVRFVSSIYTSSLLSLETLWFNISYVIMV